ncbi:UNKNOWN [Stylonychia lemnae]|uniref:Uncharacterized protein n=1 Tax=Stylonychia lemnae TaxID=5949 RepID=A0A078A540_STYLE|nr:UNKNOWN [Stylonychia lemnae]|eukprot:CDW76695.1 UNKNOWN [Stylonychia lemnae]
MSSPSNYGGKFNIGAGSGGPQSGLSPEQKKRMEREARHQREREETMKLGDYNPFGRGGAGAPLRDAQGNIITTRKVGFAIDANNIAKDPEQTRKTYEQELREQIKMKNEKVQQAKRAERMQDEMEERRVKEELDMLNQRDRQSILKEKGGVAAQTSALSRDYSMPKLMNNLETKSVLSVQFNDPGKQSISPPSYEPQRQRPASEFQMDGNRGMIHSRSEVNVGLGYKGTYSYDIQRQGYDPRDVQQLLNLRTEASKIKSDTRQTEQDLQRIQDHITNKNDWHSYYEQELSRALNMPIFKKNQQGTNQSQQYLFPQMNNQNDDNLQKNKWVSLLQNKSSVLNRQVSSREYPQSKGHALRSAAVSLFDGKPPMKFMQGAGSWDIMAGGINDNNLITESKIVPIDQYSSVYNPQFNKVEDESANLDQGVGSKFIENDREYYDQADQAIREIQELNKLSEMTHKKEEVTQMKRYASQAQLNQKLKTMDIVNYKPPKIASYKGIQNRLKKDKEGLNSVTLVKDLLQQPLMNRHGKEHDPNALDQIMDKNEMIRMENYLKQKQSQREADYKLSSQQQSQLNSKRSGQPMQIYKTDNNMHKTQVELNMILDKVADDEDEYWGREINGQIPSEQPTDRQGGGFITNMYEQSLKNFSELVPPIEQSKLDFDDQ